MKGISKSDHNIVRRIEASQELIKDYNSELYLKNSLRQAEKGWRLKYTERNGIVSIAGNADSDISTYSTQDMSEMNGSDILYIPGELNGNTVKNILPYAFAENPAVKIIVIGEGIEEIGEGAFADCPNLEHILLPSSLKTIKAGAFANCEKIEGVELPENTESIDDRAFDNNDHLTIFAETNSAAADYAQNMQYELVGIESEIENIEISRYPDKVEFSSDEEIDLSGMELHVTYMNGEEETVSEDWIVLDTLLKEGSTEVQIQYKDKRFSVPISLEVKEYEYSIEYVDIDGNTLAEGKTGTALFGTEIVETPIDIEGYTALNETYSFIVGSKDHIFNIIYQENGKINLEEGGSIDSISPQKETGAEITPDIVVKYNHQVLIKDEDYMTVYMDNVNAGNATVLVIGLNK